MKKLLLIIISLVALFAAACKQNDQQSTAPRYPITDQLLRDAVIVKPGSYFVYQDSATGGVDSFGVTTFTPSYYGYEPSQDVYYEQMGCVAYDSVGGYPAPRISYGASENSVGIGIVLHGLVGADAGLILPFTTNSHIKSGYVDAILIQHYSSLDINGNIYNDVYECTGHNTQFNTSIFQHSWFSPINGLVRFCIYDSLHRYTYSLIRSKLIK